MNALDAARGAIGFAAKMAACKNSGRCAKVGAALRRETTPR
jgi:hypothetical protein